MKRSLVISVSILLACGIADAATSKKTVINRLTYTIAAEVITDKDEKAQVVVQAGKSEDIKYSNTAVQFNVYKVERMQGKNPVLGDKILAVQVVGKIGQDVNNTWLNSNSVFAILYDTAKQRVRGWAGNDAGALKKADPSKATPCGQSTADIFIYCK